jgi:hypothetical protein
MAFSCRVRFADPCTRQAAKRLEKFGKCCKGMAGTTGLEPATSDVTGLRSALAASTIYVLFQWVGSVKVRHGSP